MSAPLPPEAPGHPFEIPLEGSLGLLALGWRGLVAWREARGRDWVEQSRTLNAAAKAERRESRRATGGDALVGTQVTVVAGLPRSGTSLVMQMLAAGGLPPATDAAREADASNPNGYYEHERVRALAAGEDAGWIAGADRRALKVVSPLVPRLPAGPAYTFVFVERDVAEVLASQRAMLARLGQAATASDARLADVYARATEAARAFADAEPGARVVTLRHRALVTDARAEAARLAEALPALDAAAMAAVVDPALYRERA
ncbi:MAG TPA: hypothetical protein VGB53_08895 [Rubricoccaceae bacterium]|jgi:hypothetical protein